MKIGVIGAGRIGKVHMKNIATCIPELEIARVYDPFCSEQTLAFLRQYQIGGLTDDVEDIWNDSTISAVLICSATDTHADYVMRAAQAGKHIFCEKPVAFDVATTRQALQAVAEYGVQFQIGFCRRFDHNHRAVYDLVRQGKVGTPQIIKISSRDPAPPTIDYVRSSGGLFFDMMIHDLDMMRFLAGSEVAEVYASGNVLVMPEIAAENDVDTALVTLRFKNGALGVIDNSRQAVYGYDQRVEVFGSEGCAQNENDISNTAILTRADGTSYGTACRIMWDRYTNAFIAEMQAFAQAIAANTNTPVGAEDALQSVLLAAACDRSLAEHRPICLDAL